MMNQLRAEIRRNAFDLRNGETKEGLVASITKVIVSRDVYKGVDEVACVTDTGLVYRCLARGSNWLTPFVLLKGMEIGKEKQPLEKK